MSRCLKVSSSNKYSYSVWYLGCKNYFGFPCSVEQQICAQLAKKTLVLQAELHRAIPFNTLGQTRHSFLAHLLVQTRCAELQGLCILAVAPGTLHSVVFLYRDPKPHLHIAKSTSKDRCTWTVKLRQATLECILHTIYVVGAYVFRLTVISKFYLHSSADRDCLGFSGLGFGYWGWVSPYTL